jgi:hypothetical protein
MPHQAGETGPPWLFPFGSYGGDLSSLAAAWLRVEYHQEVGLRKAKSNKKPESKKRLKKRP